MSKEIKDYLHLYHPQLGLKLLLNDGRIGTYEGITSSMVVKVLIDGGIIDEYVNYVKPVLRDLSDMTEVEKLHLYGMGFTHNSKGLQIEHPQKWPTFKPLQFLYLLSKGFDLFELIPAGLAINAKDLKQ